MKQFFVPEVSEEEIRKERTRARELRKSTWWKRKRAEGTCYYCRRKAAPSELTMDHIVPLVRGGRTTKGNVVAVCKECNSRKKYLLPLEWDEYLKMLQEEESDL